MDTARLPGAMEWEQRILVIEAISECDGNRWAAIIS